MGSSLSIVVPARVRQTDDPYLSRTTLEITVIKIVNNVFPVSYTLVSNTAVNNVVLRCTLLVPLHYDLPSAPFHSGLSRIPL